jgi:hypothetical protein
MLEAERVARLAFQRMRDDPTLNTTLGLGGRIHRDLAPEGTTATPTVYPLVTFSVMSAVDLKTLEGRHVWQDVELLVKVIGEFRGQAVSYGGLQPLADRIHALLEGYTVQGDGIRLVKLRRRSAPYQPPDVRAGVQHRFLNQLFATEAHAA